MALQRLHVLHTKYGIAPAWAWIEHPIHAHAASMIYCIGERCATTNIHLAHNPCLEIPLATLYSSPPMYRQALRIRGMSTSRQ